VAVVAPRDRIRGDAAHHLAALEAAGPPPLFPSDAHALDTVAAAGPWDVALDALLGTGSEGEPRGLVAAGCAALRTLASRGTRVVAVDLPTGASADSGALWAGTPHAVLTVTFGALKRGHVLWPARAACGAIAVVDIGLADPATLGHGDVCTSDAHALSPQVPRRDARAHKGTAGRVLVVGGAMGMTGAVALAARGATRAGAGYVRVLVPGSLADLLAGKLTEEMVVAAGESPARALNASARAAIEAEAEAAGAVALGTGLSRHREAAALARTLGSRLAKPLVLDADALDAFAGACDALGTHLAPRVLTPHLGEMSRLTGESAAALEARRIDAAIEWAARWGVVLVLKGAPTVTAAPDGRAEVNPTGNPGMATAGMGDVLTGALVALIAQGLPPFDAARLAVHAHGLAGDLAAAEIGPLGLAAGDVAERLPRALARIAAA
jgi:NAD(P)H-hydrate epimerase